ncbi:glycosyl hydrolase family 18 protein [Pedobacter hartonius]|uniref:chitinase n=1 Tax=Pedobacter hartonius TaxID=425514 RepID=A0A1H4D690_9SPHI|nr:glycosyl hydrolase family 18 protein [Pedobacter hartonius]SEA68234.1 Chitinase, GH18 family [Pedobacter hartonius]
MKKNKIFVLLCAITALMIASCSKKAENELNAGNAQDASRKSINNVAAAESSFRIIGYIQDWADVDQVQFDKLTHINYAFAMPNADGTINDVDKPNVLRSVVAKAHANGVKAFISIGGGTAEALEAFNALASSPKSRATFRIALLEFVDKYSLDGADIDWEYPVKNETDVDYSALMQQLSISLHNDGKQLSGVVSGSYGDFIRPSVFAQVDWINILAYDEGTTNHSTLDIAQRSLDHWLGMGLSPAKAMLGVPFYGLSPTQEALSFASLLAQGANPDSDVFNDYGYNGITTIKTKTDLAYQRGNGIMIWNVGQDAVGANSLLSAIYAEVQKLESSAAKKSVAKK